MSATIAATALALVFAGAAGCRKANNEEAGAMMSMSRTVRDLVREAQSGSARDDAAQERLKTLGRPARDELIRMLDDAALPAADAAVVFKLLLVVFPSQESGEALDRFAARQTDPMTRQILDAARAADPRWSSLAK